MSSDWVGFTDSDLQNIGNGSSPQRQSAKIVKPIQKAAGGRPKQGNLNNNRTKNGARRPTKSPVPNGALLSRPSPPPPAKVQQKVEQKIEKPVAEVKNSEETKAPAKKAPQESSSSSASTTSTSAQSSKPVVEKEIIDDEGVIQSKEKIKLEDVHQRQKEMEEKNKRKKAMLAKEIDSRRKKALAESTKLVKIQHELSKLDQLLNTDVSLLRDKIEEASFEYNYAQRRFEKAEKEYIDAKMDLHRKTSLKEDLTEHLYALIQANEQRKANKLEELMQKLDTDEAELAEKLQEIDTPPAPPTTTTTSKSEPPKNENSSNSNTAVEPSSEPVPAENAPTPSSPTPPPPNSSIEPEGLHGAEKDPK